MSILKYFIFIACFWLIAAMGSAQSKKNFEVGFNLNQIQQDYGFGVHVISPSFAKDILSVKLQANRSWLQHLKEKETVWTAYHQFQLGLRSKSEIIENKVFIYGEGGLSVIIPNKSFGSESFILGGYGLFGFEFLPTSVFAYFIELGGIGTGAVAHNLENKPIFSNGFITQVGFRIKL